MNGAELQWIVIGALVGAALGIGGAWWLLQRERLKAKEARLRMRQQLDQQNAQARKQIEKLQEDMARLRQRLALGTDGDALSAQQFEPTKPVDLEDPILGLEDNPEPERPADGFEQTRIVIQGHR